jgi:hypothetical protein
MEMAEVWIACGCPENKDEFGIPQKWNLTTLMLKREESK